VGLLEAPLYPLKPGVLRGPSGLSGGPGPLGPPHNSTTVHTAPELVSSDNRDGGTNGGVTDRERVVVGRRDAVPNGW